MTRTTTTYAATLAWGADVQTGEAEVECTYTVTWGAPAQGPSYSSGGQPADPDEIEVTITAVDGTPWAQVDPWSYGGRTLAEAHDLLAEKLVDENWDGMIAEALDEEAAVHDAAMQYRQDLERW